MHCVLGWDALGYGGAVVSITRAGPRPPNRVRSWHEGARRSLHVHACRAQARETWPWHGVNGDAAVEDGWWRTGGGGREVEDGRWRTYR